MKSQTFDSNGPDVRVRGNAHQILEKYLSLARDAASAGDRIAAENFLQHAEHYYRMLNANGDGQAVRRLAPRPDDEYGSEEPMDGGADQGEDRRSHNGGNEPAGEPGNSSSNTDNGAD
jgi:uncharacterized protein DUF4167